MDRNELSRNLNGPKSECGLGTTEPKPTSSPVLGVVVTFYNQPRDFETCIQSFAGQADEDIPIVVVDDCYPDNCYVTQICKHSGLRNIRVIRHEINRGVAAARNTGVMALASKYVLIVDGDDFLPRNALKTIRGLLDRNPEIDILISDYIVFTQDNDSHNCVRKARPPAPGELLYRQPFLGAGIVIRRSLMLTAGLYDEAPELVRGMEDREFLIRLMTYQPKVFHTEVPIYARRIPQNSRSIQCNWEQHQIREYIVRKNHDIFDNKDARNNFLAIGYMNSAEAYCGAGLVSKSARCLFHALRLDWRVVAGRVWGTLRANLAGLVRHNVRVRCSVR